VAEKRIKIPENKKDARYLDEAPPPLLHETVHLEPVCEYSHGNTKEHVSQLVHIKPLRSRMGLEGPSHLRAEKRTQNNERG
jgi:hypothetical protein